MKNLKIVSVIVLLLAVAVFYFGVNFQNSPSSQTKKPLIALSTYALYDAAKNIAGDTVECFNILPYGVEVHEFEPTPKMMARLTQADLVVYSGAGLEPWTHSFENSKNALDMSRYVTLLPALEEHDEHDTHHHHEESEFDPHYWLDVNNMIRITNVLQEQFSKILPANKKLYAQNAKRYIAKLKELDTLYSEKLSACKIDTIIVQHNAFSYLARKYGFNIESVSGLSPDAEPSAKVMQELITSVREKKIGVIFFEPFENKKIVSAIASDAHVKVDFLQPIANITKKELDANSDYVSLMKENLDKIAQARECR